MTNVAAVPFVPVPIPAGLTATQRVGISYERIDAAGRPEIWITLRSRAEVVAEAADIDARVAAGAVLPLAGMLVAVKDNIDVAGLPTTAACPGFEYRPVTTAPAVDRLVEAGAIVLGKTNLDQFATGLVGTRSPYGAVRCGWDPDRVSGGSSSGSSVAVALGLADLGIGTDTAGSGRVPAAFHGLVGLKATLGLVPTTGVVPACADYDCVTVFATELALATTALAVMAGPDDLDPRSRRWPADVRFAAPARPRVAVPRAVDLLPLEPGYRRAFAVAVADLQATGCEVQAVDISGMLDAAALLYDGAIVAERYAAVGDFLATEPAGADPTVSAIVRAAGLVTGPAVVQDQERLLRAKAEAARTLAGFDALLLPTTTEHPTIAAVQADPVQINRRFGDVHQLLQSARHGSRRHPGRSGGGRSVRGDGGRPGLARPGGARPRGQVPPRCAAARPGRQRRRAHGVGRPPAGPATEWPAGAARRPLPGTGADQRRLPPGCAGHRTGQTRSGPGGPGDRSSDCGREVAHLAGRPRHPPRRAAGTDEPDERGAVRWQLVRRVRVFAPGRTRWCGHHRVRRLGAVPRPVRPRVGSGRVTAAAARPTPRRRSP